MGPQACCFRVFRGSLFCKAARITLPYFRQLSTEMALGRLSGCVWFIFSNLPGHLRRRSLILSPLMAGLLSGESPIAANHLPILSWCYEN
jgi:hypothetical protein